MGNAQNKQDDPKALEAFFGGSFPAEEANARAASQEKNQASSTELEVDWPNQSPVANPAPPENGKAASSRTSHQSVPTPPSIRRPAHEEEAGDTMPPPAPIIPQPDSSSGLRFDELYRLRDVLGTGAFSTVREGYHRRDRSRSFAIKCVIRAKLTDEDAAALLDEVAILKELTHRHIIRLYDFFEEPANYYLIMERMSGGELFDRIVAKAYYNEKEARDVCRILIESVGYCHKHGVAHRDLKPENLLLVSEDNDAEVKIADFGFAKKVLAPKTLTTQCGTPGYVAPEILEGIPYDTRADMWSVGVILYILLGGYPPFIENNQRELFRKIRRGDYEFHEEYWGTVSKDAKNLISSLLTVNPDLRLTAPKALQNKWICGDDKSLAEHDLGRNHEKLRAFNGKRKFRAAVSTVMAVNKLQSLGKDFLRNLDE
eukprot:CAMPEP_0113540584 /NCGR_PEP_ID=MMETSP0015_2-20120614/8561_1 /TAXON_ID=2838 /ORGANISM="Odontella" /LENGTH=428 /DNA_ID=CAMNT_0000440403 /DNA_START=55 /DNA_END=1341 /DNA_ORIENTATION=- /assembly_acc=CAM_ASM_000160